jgi:hypothetical protein
MKYYSPTSDSSKAYDKTFAKKLKDIGLNYLRGGKA